MGSLWLALLAIACTSVLAQSTSGSFDPNRPAHQPIPVDTPQAEFPSEASAKNLRGMCAVSLDVDKEGSPLNVRILRCTDPVFAGNSLDAARRYRFKPATSQDGKPVVAHISINVSFRFGTNDMPAPTVACEVSSPPGTSTSDPDPDGVYPLTRLIAPPKITKFTDKDYGVRAFSVEDEACDVTVTVDPRGRALKPGIVHCAKSGLETAALESILASRFRPGSINGKPVPVRLTFHLHLAGN